MRTTRAGPGRNVHAMRSFRPLLAIATAAFATCATQHDPSPPNATADRGAELFARHCAVCHGDAGDADTLVAELLLPRPTAFREGLFKLASTANGVPTEDDLVATLRRGMPGSTMMAWGWLPDSDLRALAREVQRLAVRGRAASIERTAAIGRQPMLHAQALAMAEQQLAPGPVVETGVPGPITDANLAEGERLYRLHCASCHGTDGRGLPQTGGWASGTAWLWPRDFTAGYLRGSAAHRDLAFRIRAGMPGAHMPPTRLTTAETTALVGYVAGLIPETAADHHVQWRRTVRVPRLAALPADDDDAAAARIEAIRLPLAPLWWRPEAVSEVWLRAAHDGETLWWQLEWTDATRDDRPQPGRAMGDGAAVQFAFTADAPLFAMGSTGVPVNVWRWHAFDPKETAGLVDLLGGAHSGLDVTPAALRPQPRSESLQLGGVGTAAAATGSGLPLGVATRWRDARWTATFRRPLKARSEREVDLTGPGPVLFALAIWNGSIDHHAGSKAITTWHALELEGMDRR